jgi:hypothetical protein
MRKPWPRPAVVVIGADDIGSAIAVALAAAGYATVVCDEVDPSWARRGMAFTDAWYVGSAELAGTTAVFCATVKSIPALLDAPRRIAATTWSWSGVCTALPTLAVIDTRPRSQGVGPDLRTRVHDGQLTIGIGAGYAVGRNAHVVIDAGGVDDCAAAFDDRARDSAGTDECGGIVRAASAGRFATACRIGEAVRRGEIVGMLDQHPIAAPRSGVLRGLSARGARIRPGDAIVEVDAGGDPERCFGIAPRAVAIAGAVLDALAPRTVTSPRQTESAT